MGVSDALHTGFGFFGHPNAAPAAPPCGWPIAQFYGEAGKMTAHMQMTAVSFWTAPWRWITALESQSRFRAERSDFGWLD